MSNLPSQHTAPGSPVTSTGPPPVPLSAPLAEAFQSVEQHVAQTYAQAVNTAQQLGQVNATAGTAIAVLESWSPQLSANHSRLGEVEGNLGEVRHRLQQLTCENSQLQQAALASDRGFQEMRQVFEAFQAEMRRNAQAQAEANAELARQTAAAQAELLRRREEDSRREALRQAQPPELEQHRIYLATGQSSSAYAPPPVLNTNWAASTGNPPSAPPQPLEQQSRGKERAPDEEPRDETSGSGLTSATRPYQPPAYNPIYGGSPLFPPCYFPLEGQEQRRPSEVVDNFPPVGPYVQFPPDLAHTGNTLMDHLLATPREPGAPAAKVQVPTFNGSNLDVTSWLRAMDVMFMAKGVNSDLERLRWTRPHLTGAAAEFFETIQGVPTWAQFKQQLLERFHIFGVEYRYRANFHNLHQQGEDIVGYISEFRRRFQLVPEVSQREAIYAFQKGLNPQVRLHVNAATPTTVAQAIDIARKWQIAHSQENLHAPLPAEAKVIHEKLSDGIEYASGARGYSKQFKPPRQYRAPSVSRSNSRGRSQSPGRRPSPFRPQRRYGGYYNTESPTPKSNFPKGQQKPGNCYNCGKAGHWSAECRQPRRGRSYQKPNSYRSNSSGGSSGSRSYSSGGSGGKYGNKGKYPQRSPRQGGNHKGRSPSRSPSRKGSYSKSGSGNATGPR